MPTNIFLSFFSFFLFLFCYSDQPHLLVSLLRMLRQALQSCLLGLCLLNQLLHACMLGMQHISQLRALLLEGQTLLRQLQHYLKWYTA